MTVKKNNSKKNNRNKIKRTLVTIICRMVLVNFETKDEKKQFIFLIFVK